MTGVEALADAIMTLEGWSPGSRSNRNRNPGNLRAGAGQVGEDPEGYAIFASLADGYRSLCDDVTAKVSGQNKHGLSGSSTLAAFFGIYAPAGDHNDPSHYAGAVAVRVSKALGRTVTVASTLAEICPEVKG